MAFSPSVRQGIAPEGECVDGATCFRLIRYRGGTMNIFILLATLAATVILYVALNILLMKWLLDCGRKLGRTAA